MNLKKVLCVLAIHFIAVSALTVSGNVVRADELSLGKVNCDLLNARELPDTDAKWCFTLANDTNVDIIGSYKDWYKVKYKEYVGWAKKDSISMQQSKGTGQALTSDNSTATIAGAAASNENNTATGTGKAGYINADDVNLRETPDLQGVIIRKLSKSTVVELYEVQDNFRKCKVDGKVGWVSYDFANVGREDTLVSRGSTNTGTSNNTEESTAKMNKTAYIKGTNVNVRKEAGLNGELVSRLSNGKKITIVAESGNWYSIQASDIKGWVNKEYISMQEPAAVNDNSKTNSGTGQASGSGSNSGTSSGTKKNNTTNSNQGGAPAAADSATAGNVIEYAKSFLGTRYVYGGMSPSGFDCSGFVSYVYKHFGVSLNRSSASMASNGTYVSKDNLQPGDLVFFATGGGGTISHVGMYIGNGQFIHCASGKAMQVIISGLNTGNYVNQYVTARRVL